MADSYRGVQVGDRIRLLRMENDPCPLPVGSTGTVDWINRTSMGTQIGVAWDNGRSLLLVDEDLFEKIKDTE